MLMTQYLYDKTLTSGDGAWQEECMRVEHGAGVTLSRLKWWADTHAHTHTHLCIPHAMHAPTGARTHVGSATHKQEVLEVLMAYFFLWQNKAKVWRTEGRGVHCVGKGAKGEGRGVISNGSG